MRTNLLLIHHGPADGWPQMLNDSITDSAVRRLLQRRRFSGSAELRMLVHPDSLGRGLCPVAMHPSGRVPTSGALSEALRLKCKCGD